MWAPSIGTPYYLSPEICEDRPYNRKSDVWALGCVLYELATLNRAFDGQSLPALVVKILKGKYPPVPPRYSSQLRSLVDSMLKQNPKDRPSTEAILRLDYVRAHVERYAAHVMAIGAGQPEGLGLAKVAPARELRAPRAGAGLPAKASGATAARPSPHLPKARRGSAPVPQAGSTCAALPRLGGSPASPASGAEAASCSSAPEGSPANPAPGRAPGRKAPLSATAWMGRQQAALAELEGALAAQRGGPAARRPPSAAPAPAPACADDDDGAEPEPEPERARPQPQPQPQPHQRPSSSSPGAQTAGELDATIPSAAVTVARGKLAGGLKQQRDAELEAQRRAVAAQREQKKVALVKRSQEQATMQRQRVAGRQQDVGRHVAEHRAELEAKARKALQLAAAIKQKEEVRRREAEEVAQHMRAHQEQVRAARSHVVSKDHLSKLGAEFAARRASSTSTVGQVVLVDFPPSGSASPAAQTASATGYRSSGSSPAARAPLQARGSPATAGQRQPAQSPLARGSAASDSEAAGPSGRGKGAAAGPPPWKQRHSKAPGGVEFPAVQIYTPFGSGAAPHMPGQQQVEQAAAAWAQAGNEDVLEVLAQIQTVLQDRDQPAGGDMPGPDDGADGGAATLRRGGDGLEAPGSTAAAAAANAHKVEQLRMGLEQELGEQAFLQAYRLLREMEEGEDEDEDGSGGRANQASLEGLLGRKLHLVRQIHKLITQEDAVFSS